MADRSASGQGKMTREVRSALAHAGVAFAVVVVAVAVVCGLVLGGVLSPNRAKWEQEPAETSTTIVIYP
ncbi:MAG: hypothetical protein N3B14_09040 [Thermoleophilia bacterium]|nr:hypothetical protein [Thermoleophilia bacterium]